MRSTSTSTGRKTLASAGGGLTLVKGNFLHDRSVKQAIAAGVYFGPVYAPRLLSNPGARSMEVVVRETFRVVGSPEGRPSAGTGVVGETLDLRVIQDLVRQTRLGTSGYVYAIDARGVPIAHPNSAAFTNRSLALPQVTRALASQTGSTVGRNFRGQRVLSTWATVGPVGWKVFVEQPESAAFAPVRGKIWRTALLLAAFLAVGVGLSVLLARRLVRPVKQIRTAAARIGAGAYDERIELRRRDELGGLADELNGMAASLQASVQSLERKVEERTQELQRALAELSRKGRQLEVASEHKSHFLANMSHELRTPLNAIIGFSQVLRQRMFGPINEKQEEYLDDILSSGNHLLSLINDVLDLSKVEAGQVELEVASFSLREALERGVVMVREPATKHGVRLSLELGARRRPGRGDERRLAPGRLQPALERRQVHAGGGGRRRHREPRPRGTDLGDRHGSGHPTRGPGADLRGVPADGCRRAAARGHRARARPFEAPRRAARRPHLGRERARARQPLRLHAAGEGGEPMLGERVLVVEDNEKNMKLVRDVLQATGYSTLEATTGEEAVELALSQAPALVLMDVQLPGIDGVEALERLRQNERTASIPVLALTAQAMSGDRERFLEAGFDGYLAKPVDVGELIEAVREHCDRG